MSFYRQRDIRSTRSNHQCECCHAVIDAGSPAIYLSCSNGDGDAPFFGHMHADCRKAEVELNNLHDFRSGDDWLALSEREADDDDWLAEEYPAVLARLVANKVRA